MRPIIGLVAVAALLIYGGARAAQGEGSPATATDEAAANPSRPVKLPEIAEVQRRLKALGFAVGKVDGVLGPRTRKAIDAYLVQHNLPATGWISPDLITEIEGGPAAVHPPVPERAKDSGIVQESLRGTDPDTVKLVQRRLKELGYYTGPVDGVVDAALTSSIKDYEAVKGRPVTGWIFPDLVAELAAVPAEAPPAEPTAPVVPAVKLWQPADMVGKTLHALPGDRLGRIGEIVIGGDGVVAGVVARIENLYGDAASETLIPWGQVAPSVGRAAVILPLDANQAMKLRRHPAAFVQGGDQILSDDLIGARVRVDGKRWGRVQGAVFEQGGKLSRLVVQGRDQPAPQDVAAEGVTLVPADDAVDLREAPNLERFQSGAS